MNKGKNVNCNLLAYVDFDNSPKNASGEIEITNGIYGNERVFYGDNGWYVITSYTDNKLGIEGYKLATGAVKVKSVEGTMDHTLRVMKRYMNMLIPFQVCAIDNGICPSIKLYLTSIPDGLPKRRKRKGESVSGLGYTVQLEKPVWRNHAYYSMVQVEIGDKYNPMIYQKLDYERISEEFVNSVNDGDVIEYKNNKKDIKIRRTVSGDSDVISNSYFKLVRTKKESTDRIELIYSSEASNKLDGLEWESSDKECRGSLWLPDLWDLLSK